MIALSQFLGDGLDGTEPAYADITFDTDYTLEFGGFSFEIMHRGPAQTPGDSFIWLDERDVMFTGEIVYVGRILGNGPVRDTEMVLVLRPLCSPVKVDQGFMSGCHFHGFGFARIGLVGGQDTVGRVRSFGVITGRPFCDAGFCL